MARADTTIEVTRDARGEVGALARLAGPIALTYVGNQLLGAVDTAVVGRLGEVPLGAVGLGNGLLFAVTVIGLGLVLGLDPLISQAMGAGEERRARSMLWQALWLSVGLTPPLAVAIVGVVAVLAPAGIDPDIARETAGYLHARLPGLFFFLLLVGGRSYLQACSLTMPMVVATIVANVVNLPLSWLLVFGDEGLIRFGLTGFGVPQLGAAGAGWTSSVCTVLQAGIVFAAIRRIRVPPGGRLSRGPDRDLLRRAVRVGTPIALAILAEVGSFTIVGIAMGYLGPRSLAAHSVALTLASAAFQVPLAIGSAAAVRVGGAVGREDRVGTRRAGIVAISSGGAFMMLAAIAFVSFPDVLAGVISNEAEVIAAAVPLILVAAAFQLVDGIQTVGGGALRGAGDTRYALWANVVGHYALGLPIGLWLTWGLRWGAPGLWWGLSIGLTCVAVALSLRFLRITRGAIARS